MLPVNYVPSKQLRNERDFPPRDIRLQDLHAQDSLALAGMVAIYLMAMFAGIGLFGYLTTPLYHATAVHAQSVLESK